MSKSTKSSEAAVIRLANKSTLSAEFELQLDMIKLSPEDYRHREEADLDAEKESMKVLKDSLRSEGLLEPLIVYRDIQAGHMFRSPAIAAVLPWSSLADANVEGFTRSMPVRVREILGGYPRRLLLDSGPGQHDSGAGHRIL